MGQVIEQGVLEFDQSVGEDEDSRQSSNKLQGGFVPFEHMAYASKGLAAITVTVRKEPFQSRTQKYSVLDTHLCLCKLSKVLFLLNEAVAQTIVSPDLQIDA